VPAKLAKRRENQDRLNRICVEKATTDPRLDELTTAPWAIDCEPNLFFRVFSRVSRANFVVRRKKHDELAWWPGSSCGLVISDY